MEGGTAPEEGGAGTSVPDARGDAIPPDVAPALDGCVERRSVLQRRGLNLFLLVDDSPSVVLQPVWDRLTQAITAFVDDPARDGIGVGVEYYGISCDPGDYATPAVPIGELPGVAPNIKASYPLPVSGKAISPAIRGATTYVRSVITNGVDRDTVLVLMSDGILDPLCGSTAASAEGDARDAFVGSPSVRTHVIALGAGPTLVDPADLVNLSSLDALAAAGGTTEAARVAVDTTTTTQLAAALDGIVTKATPCAFRIPADFDERRIVVEWAPEGSQSKTTWPLVTSATACGDRPGAYVRDAAPGYVELCPASCDTLRANPGSPVWARETCAPRL